MAAVVLIYDGTIFYSRWSQAREGKRAEAAEEAERARAKHWHCRAAANSVS